ncbi:MAG: YciI family protein [Limnohabitans sp.]
MRLERSAGLQDRAAASGLRMLGGPLTHDDGTTMMGSLLVIDLPSRDAAHAWLADEPFTKARLYGSTAVHAFVNLWPQKVGFAPPA